MIQKLIASGGCLIALAFAAFGIAQFYAGAQEISNEFGGWWSFGAIAAALIFRFTLPLTIASYFYARDWWEWPWYFAALFAAPGLLFVVPGTIAAVLDSAKSALTRNS